MALPTCCSRPLSKAVRCTGGIFRICNFRRQASGIWDNSQEVARSCEQAVFTVPQLPQSVFNNLNKQMQSYAPQFHKLLRSAEACARTIMDCYLKWSYTQGVQVSKVEYRNPKCFLPKEDMYIGGQATALSSSRECALTAQQSQFLCLRCLDFYIESVDQILKWIPFQKSVLRHLELLDPAVCMNGSAASTAPLAQAFPN